MSGCATYVADPSFQITQGGATGPYDCTAHSASDAIDHATCGAKDPSGRSIRLASSEPVPDPRSPGLNLAQVASVALRVHGVYLEVHTGANALTFAQFEAKRADGHGGIIQVQYARIADTKYDAFGSRFRGGHAMFESLHASYDPGADGRITGSGERAWRHDGTVYPRELIKRAAGDLIIDAYGHRVGYGKIWCALTRDVVPDFVATIRPENRFFRFFVDSSERIIRREAITNRSTTAECSPPEWYAVHPSHRGTGEFAKNGYSLVKITDRNSSYRGWLIPRRFAYEV